MQDLIQRQPFDFSKAIHQSDLAKFYTCPMSFYFSLIANRPEEFRHVGAVCGTAGHMTINHIIENHVEYPSLQACRNLFRDFLETSERGEDPQSIKRYKGKIPPVLWERSPLPRETYIADFGLAIHRLHSDPRFTQLKHRLFEADFSVMNEGVLIQGTIDDLSTDKHDNLVLSDFKFSKSRPSFVVLDRSIQFSIYSFACLAGTFHFTDKENNPQTYALHELPDIIQIVHMRDLIPMKSNRPGRAIGDDRGQCYYITRRTIKFLESLFRELKTIFFLLREGLYFRTPNDIGACRGFCRHHDSCMNDLEGLPLEFNRRQSGKQLIDFEEGELNDEQHTI